jgi:hypothetical protein
MEGRGKAYWGRVGASIPILLKMPLYCHLIGFGLVFFFFFENKPNNGSKKVALEQGVEYENFVLSDSHYWREWWFERVPLLNAYSTIIRSSSSLTLCLDSRRWFYFFPSGVL